MSEQELLTRRNAVCAAALGALAMTLPAEARSHASITDLRAVVMAHNKAFSAQDMKGVLATMSPRATLMGSVPGELWVGHSEIADAYKHFFDDFEAGKQKFENLYMDGHVNGDMAWAMGVSKVTMTKGADTREFGLNTSMTFERTGGAWLIRTLHFSNLTKA